MSRKEVLATTGADVEDNSWNRPMMAKQANSAVLVRYGDTVVLTAAVGTKQAKMLNFFP